MRMHQLAKGERSLGGRGRVLFESLAGYVREREDRGRRAMEKGRRQAPEEYVSDGYGA